MAAVSDAPATTPGPPIYFVELKEVKGTHNGRKSYKFFLVDNNGQEHLAATGEEIADAHYNYQSTAEFASYGGVHGHTRKELIMWLEQVIKESGQAARGEALDADHVVHIGEPTPADPFGIFFVRYRSERTHLPDGRRCNKWWLVDQHGKEHLAVVGEERDTRDAHYFYHATEPFAAQHPLDCNNQSRVLKWIEAMLTHHYPPGVTPVDAGAAMAQDCTVWPEAGAQAGTEAGTQAGTEASAQAGTEASAQARTEAGAQPGTDMGVAQPAVSAGVGDGAQQALGTPTWAPRTDSQGTGPLFAQPIIKSGGHSKGVKPGSGKSAGAAKPPGTKHKLVGVAQDAHLKRLRRLAAESEEALRAAEAAHLMRLRRTAEAETASREAVRRSTATWVRGELGADEERTLTSALETLQQLLVEANKEEVQQVQYNALRLQPDLNQQLAGVTPVELVIQPAGELAGAAAAEAATQPAAEASQQAATGSQPSVLGPAAADSTLPAAAASQEASQPGAGDTSCMEVDPAPPCLPAPSPSQEASDQQATQAPAGDPPGHPAAGVGRSKGSGGLVQVETQTVHTWTYADPHTNKHAVRLALECLREVESVMLPLQVMLSSPLIDLVRVYAEQHPHPAVSQLAGHILGVWQRSALARLRALVSPGLLEDPVAQLELRIARGMVEYPADIVQKQKALQAQLSPVTSTPLPSLLSFNTTPNSDTLPFTAIDLSASLAAACMTNGKGLPTTPSLHAPMGTGAPAPYGLPPLMLTPAAASPALARTFTATSPPPAGSSGNFGPTLALDLGATVGRSGMFNPLPEAVSQVDLADAAARAWPTASLPAAAPLGTPAAIQELTPANASAPLCAASPVTSQLQAASGQGLLSGLGAASEVAGSVCAPLGSSPSPAPDGLRADLAASSAMQTLG